MAKKKKSITGRHFWLNAGLTVLLFAFLLTAATWAVLSFQPLYHLVIRILNIPQETGYSYETCKVNYDVLIRYNQFFGPTTLAFPDFPMSDAGRQHFAEVRQIFVIMQYVAMGSFVLLIPGVIVARKKQAWGWLKATIILTLTVIAAVGFAILINWNWTFTVFHKIVFRNDFWIFNGAKDPIIYILPDEAFLADGVAILVLMGTGLVIAGLVYRRKKRAIAKMIAKKRK